MKNNLKLQKKRSKLDIKFTNIVTSAFLKLHLSWINFYSLNKSYYNKPSLFETNKGKTTKSRRYFNEIFKNNPQNKLLRVIGLLAQI